MRACASVLDRVQACASVLDRVRPCSAAKMAYTVHILTLFSLDFLRVPKLGRGGGLKVPAKPVNDNEMKFGEVYISSRES